MENVKDKAERLKAKAELFLDKDLRVFIKTYNKDFYFDCDILIVGDIRISFYCNHERKLGEHFLNWLDIDDIEEYEVRE